MATPTKLLQQRGSPQSLSSASFFSRSPSRTQRIPTEFAQLHQILITVDDSQIINPLSTSFEGPVSAIEETGNRGRRNGPAEIRHCFRRPSTTVPLKVWTPLSEPRASVTPFAEMEVTSVSRLSKSRKRLHHSDLQTSRMKLFKDFDCPQSLDLVSRCG